MLERFELSVAIELTTDTFLIEGLLILDVLFRLSQLSQKSKFEFKISGLLAIFKLSWKDPLLDIGDVFILSDPLKRDIL
jgi:hypothetical protein